MMQPLFVTGGFSRLIGLSLSTSISRTSSSISVHCSSILCLKLFISLVRRVRLVSCCSSLAAAALDFLWYSKAIRATRYNVFYVRLVDRHHSSGGREGARKRATWLSLLTRFFFLFFKTCSYK